jgi:outer membrane protein
MPLVRRIEIGAIALLLLAWSPLADALDTTIEPGSQLTLQRAIELARKYHPAHLAAVSEAGAARERIGEARASLMPQVLGAAQYLRATDNGIGDSAYLSVPGLPREPTQGRNSNSAETFDNYLMGVSVYQHLFDFGRTRGLIDERQAEADAAAARLKFIDLDLVFGVTERYYRLLAAKQKVRVFDKAVAQRAEHVREAEVKAQAGLKSEIDTYTTKAELARAKLHLVDAQNEVATAKAALDNAMGLGSEAPDYHQADVLTYVEIVTPLDEYVEAAYRQRADLTMFEDETRAVGAQIRELKSDYLPTVGATAGYSARGQDLPASNNFDVGVLVSWPLFNGFRTDHEVAEAKLRQDAIGQALQDLRQRIFLQVKSSYLDWQASRQRIHRAEETVAASRAERDLADKRYESGLGNIIELTDAQRRFTEDEAAYVNSLAEFSIAKAALARATGSDPGGG